MLKHLELLGQTVTDKVTGYRGVVTTVSFDLYGCIQAIVTPPEIKDGIPVSGAWFDVNRLAVTSKKRVMEVPDFASPGPVAEGKKGAANKSLPPQRQVPGC